MACISIYGRIIRLLIDRIAFKLEISAIDFNRYHLLLLNLHSQGLLTYPRYHDIHDIETVRAKMTLRNSANPRRSQGVVVTLYRGYGACVIKFDWSPWLVDDRTIGRFSSLLAALVPDGFRGLITRGLVCYLEIAIDVCGVRVQDHFFTYPRFARSYVYYNPRDGSQSTYIGNRKSRVNFCCYDKKAQFRRCHARITRGELMRLECRLRQPRRFEELYALNDPFAGLLVSNILNARSLDGEPRWPGFVDQSEDQGAQRALTYYADHIKRTFRRMLALARPDWWQPEEIWRAWPIVLDEFMTRHTVDVTPSTPIQRERRR